MKRLTLATTTLALALGATATDAHADGRKAGSVLIFPVHRSGIWNDVVIDPVTGPALVQTTLFTILCVTNTNTDPETPISVGGSTNVHYEYVNVVPGADWHTPASCTVFDRVDYLTPGDTFCVLTSCHNAIGFGQSQAREGYVVVSAENPLALPGTSWDHDWLIGSELVMSSTGVAYQTNAVALQGLQGPGNPTTHPSGRLLFDGFLYEQLPDVLMTDYVAALGAQLSLINFTGNYMTRNHVAIAVYNDNEYALSAHFSFSCWFNEPLATVSPLFTEGFLLSTPHDPYELLLNCNYAAPVTVETGWMSIQSTGVTLPSGDPFVGGPAVPPPPAPGPLGPGPQCEECEEEEEEPVMIDDGALLGSITSASSMSIGGGHLLWENGNQGNGSFRN